MPNPEEKLQQLQIRLENLAKYEAAFKREIADIRREINLLKSVSRTEKGPSPKTSPPGGLPKPEEPRRRPPVREPETRSAGQPPPSFTTPTSDSQTRTGSKGPNLERFVGTYLISIIGVLITVIGVGIGAKYAIDNNLVSPLLRIVLGYAVGVSLIVAAVYLKPKYETFSAVLLSGGMAIMYFITYFAYGYYGLISQTAAFVLMVLFTVATVFSAIIYNRQVIANIGLVGAYAVPFLLSEDSGRADILFSYIAIINIGILVLSVKKYWRALFYLSFVFTWLIFAAWFFDKYNHTKHFGIAFASITVFYLTFYICFLAYKLIHKKPLEFENVGLVLINSFAFFGFGYALLDRPSWEEYLGLFTIGNAAVHFAVAFLIHKYKLGDRNAFYFAAALVLVFVTIAVPVQAKAHSITILWMAEAAFLFIVGRVKKVPLFEYLSYPLMIFASFSLFENWQDADRGILNRTSKVQSPIFNRDFVTSLFSAFSFGAIFYVNRLRQYTQNVGEAFYKLIRYLFPTVFLAILYNTFRIEIGTYFYLKDIQTAVRTASTAEGSHWGFINDVTLVFFNTVWQINYTLLFAALLGYLNAKRLKQAVLGFVNLGLVAILIPVFLVLGLFSLGGLREIYLDPEFTAYFYRGMFLIGVRYFSIFFLAVLIYCGYLQMKNIGDAIPKNIVRIIYELGICFTALVILSNELVNWLEIYKTEDPFRLGLSILWALYALALIVFGIARKRKDIRIFAITLFGFTLFKLFIYDMYDLETIPKTILFVSIGFLLLIASFLYNKYTKLIFGEEKANK